MGLAARRVCLLLTVLWWCSDVAGQSLPFRHYTPDSDIAPLPSAYVRTVLQDDGGFVWFAVYSSGLVRYDGERLTTYTASDGLSDLNVADVVQDANGRLWVGSNSGVVVSERALSDYRVGERVTFSDSLGLIPLPTDEAVAPNHLVADSTGFVWAAPGRIILRYDVRSPTPSAPDTFRYHEPLLFQSIEPLSNGELLATGLTRQGGFVWLVDPDSSTITVRQQFDDGVPASSRVLPGGVAFLGTREGALYRSDDVFGDAPFRRVFDGIDGLVVGIVARTDNDLWLATQGSGLVRARVDHQGRGVGFAAVSGALGAEANQVMVDREQNLWVAQAGGASRLPHNFDAFDSYTSGDDNPALIDDLVTSVQPPGRNDCLWAGTVGGGVACIDAVGRSRIIRDELPSNRINGLVRAHDGTLWLGGDDGVVAIAPPLTTLPDVASSASIDLSGLAFGSGLLDEAADLASSFATRTFRVRTFDGLDATIQAVGSLQVETSSGSGDSTEVIWFSSTESIPLYVDGTWSILVGNGLPASTFYSVGVDNLGMMWVGSEDQGLFRSVEPVSADRLKPRSGSRSPDLEFELVWSEENGAPSNEIESILFHQGVLWVGTGGGVAGLDPASGVMGFLIDEASGLPAQNGTSMAVSPTTGTIWVGTNGGLAEIDPESHGVLRTVTSADGLVNNEVCYYGSVRIDYDGSVYYGTCSGLAVYRPQLDRDNERPPEPAITSARYSETGWGNNELVVEYAGLSFANEPLVAYQTRLVGYDEDWSEPSVDARIRYTNLPAYLFPKMYAFEVRAANESGVWSTSSTSVPISVKPPWWLRWWFVLLFHVMVGSSIFAYVRHKTRQNEIKLAKEREINDQLRRVDKLKDEFLANTSHELRTPLNGIIGIVDSLLDGVAGEMTDVMQHNLQTVISSGRRLASLVDDILDFSKLKEKGLELNVKPVSVNLMAEVVLRLTTPLVAGKDILLSNDIDGELPPAMADEDRLQQILLNVVGNAVKFTHEGEVRLFAEERGDVLAVSVADTGIGIPPEKADAVFESFEQVDASTSRDYGGTGLGLSVTKQLVELHGGEIGFESEVGAGTTFTFTLPIARGEEAAAALTAAEQAIEQLTPLQVEPPSGDGAEPIEDEAARKSTPTAIRANGYGRNDDESITVLVVDDEPVNQQVLANHLANQNFEVVQALNGQQAIKALESGRKFDVVLLDVMMPRMSGYEVCERIRQEYMPSELPVIMVTAKNQVADLVHGLDVGANDYLAKPFSKDELIARLRTHLNLLHINTSYGRFVPHEFLRYLDKDSFLDVSVGDSVEKYMTIFSSDIRSFTTISEGMTPEENFRFINEYMGVAGPVIRYHDGFIDSYIGDAIMALFAEKPDDALDAAIDTFRGLRVLNEERAGEGKIPVRIGIGIHYGKLQLGIVGELERAQPDIISDAVNLTARIEGLTKHYGASVIVSREALEALQHPELYRTRILADVMVKGKNEPVRLIEMFDGDSEEVIQLRVDTLEDYDAGREAYNRADFPEALERFGSVLRVNPADKAAAMYHERATELAQSGVDDEWSHVDRLDFK